MQDDGCDDVAGPGLEPGPDRAVPGGAVSGDVSFTPGWAVPGVDRPSALSEALRVMRAGLEAARAVTVLSDVDCRDGVREFDQFQSEVESFWLGLVADLDARPGAVPGVRAGSTAVAFLAAGLNRSHAQARRDVAAAKALTAPTGMPPGAGTAPGVGDVGDVGPSAPSAPLVRVGEAFAAGDITREHVDVATRCWSSIPTRVLDAVDDDGLSGTARVDAFLAVNARTFDPARLARLAKELQRVLDPDKEDPFDPEAFLRRTLSLHDSPDGMTLGKLQLDPASAVWLKTALEHFANPTRNTQDEQSGGQQGGGQQGGGEQGELPIRDDRTRGQRLHDALIEICRLAMDADPTRTRREPPHVTIITTPEQLADAHTREATAPAPGAKPASGAVFPGAASGGAASGGAASGGAASGGAESGGADPTTPPPGLAEAVHAGPLSPATLARLTCDAILQAVVLDSRTGAVLNLGRTRRTASLAQRKALTARDRGCVIPGCHAPPGRCDAHHVQPWSAGGHTNIDALALLCETHHTQTHLGIWTLTMIDRIPHVEPPPWHRLAGSGPIRNRLHDAVHHARKLAQQMRLDLPQDHLKQAGGRAGEIDEAA